MKAGIGDKIIITIGDREIETVIDEHGVQRLPRNPIYDDLFNKGLIDLNSMIVRYHQKKIEFEDYFEFYLHIGYSVSGFSELSCFQHLDIKNPLWE